MACYICDHTTQKVADSIYWCPRCGTLQTIHANHAETDVPKLVERCRKFETWCKEGSGWSGTNHYKEWVGVGIAESINTPENRPKGT